MLAYALVVFDVLRVSGIGGSVVASSDVMVLLALALRSFCDVICFFHQCSFLIGDILTGSKCSGCMVMKNTADVLQVPEGSKLRLPLHPPSRPDA